MTPRTLVPVALACVLFASAAAGAGLTQADLGEVAATPKLGAELPLAARFATRAGTDVTLGEAIGGRPALLVFADLTCDTLCGPSLSGLAGALAGLDLAPGRDYALVVASIDPKDGPQDAARMASDQLGAGQARAATFLLGEGVAPLARAAGFRFRYDAAHDAFAHPVGAFALSGEGRIVRFLSGMGFTATDLRLALAEARAGAGQAPAIERLLLLCYRYDPVTGVYTPVIRGALVASALTAVAVLALGIGLLLARERRARRRGAGAAR